MNEDTKRVLEMLAQGKINAAEAERLLERLAAGGGGRSAAPGGGAAARAAESAGGDTEPAAPGGTPKYLRVVVDSVQGDRVNIRVPLALVRTGIKLGAMLPEHARQQLQEKGIDLSQLSGMESEEMIQALRELTVNVDSAQGDTVRVFCE
jgi:hypothetical protein